MVKVSSEYEGSGFTMTVYFAGISVQLPWLEFGISAVYTTLTGLPVLFISVWTGISVVPEGRAPDTSPASDVQVMASPAGKEERRTACICSPEQIS